MLDRWVNLNPQIKVRKYLYPQKCSCAVSVEDGKDIVSLVTQKSNYGSHFYVSYCFLLKLETLLLLNSAFTTRYFFVTQ